MLTKLDKIKKPIKEEMVDFEGFFKDSLKSQVPLLSVITNFVLRRRGKQMRPMFVFMSAKLNGEINKSVYYAASFIELLHTATLIHDDVVDESYERRGFFSINALWKSKIAVLVGDFLLSKGMLMAVENNEFALLKIVSSAVQAMSEGELKQIEKTRKMNITEEEYFDVIKKKTAVLISACTEGGARAVGAGEENIENMRSLGEKVGIAFQIRDDLFDYQKTNSIGKPIGNDIKEKKITLPLIFALNQVSVKEQRRILRIVKHQKKNSRDIQYVVDFVKEHGGLDYARTKMNEYTNSALDILNFYPESDIKNSFAELIQYTTKRKE